MHSIPVVVKISLSVLFLRPVFVFLEPQVLLLQIDCWLPGHLVHLMREDKTMLFREQECILLPFVPP